MPVRVNAKAIADIIQIGIITALVYYSTKFVVDLLDPVKKRQGKMSQQEVNTLLALSSYVIDLSCGYYQRERVYCGGLKHQKM